MFLRNPFIGAFGLDIGDLSIKLVQLERHASYFHPTHYKTKEIRGVDLLPGYIADGELQQPEMVRKKLLLLLGKEGKNKLIKSPWVVANLPEPKTFLKLIEIEVAPEDLTTEDVEFQAKKHLPMDLGEVYLDWQVVGHTDKTTQILLGAVAKIISDSYTYLLESVGLNIVALEIEALSVARSMITANKSYIGEARMILDLGAVRSNLILYDNNSIQFSTKLNFSGNLINTALSQHLKISWNEAEHLKIKNGLAYDNKSPKYLKVVAGLTDELLVDIKKNLQFYEEHFSNPNPITHIALCGGTSALANLDTEIAKKMKIPSTVGNPWRNVFDKQVANSDQTMSSSLAAAIGLGLRAAQDPFEKQL
jgi:type IV pilus assembly protein PilM